MGGRIIGYLGIRRIPVVIAREITVRGTVVARRLVDTIDAKVVDVIFRKVEHAYHGNILFTEEQKKQLTEVRITYALPLKSKFITRQIPIANLLLLPPSSMPHESDLDLDNHLSFVADKEEEPDFLKGHVTTNPAQQKVVRRYRKISASGSRWRRQVESRFCIASVASN
ncbi:predicted protein [Coccidioides posadasii str. Silveira]|uniref:Predicted protein n=1 Tax=Coccidioides posadasii (strain RMSCC 757 / Silveira) TaxID=443226 RepID=E9CRV8_COCPS|nr:predicted protein [Coccidioides posadasii str. Silveira]